jgi:hypothetical protein
MQWGKALTQSQGKQKLAGSRQQGNQGSTLPLSFTKLQDDFQQ